ncbi:MAG: ribosome biogenesis factor YjgA [Pseudomonadota bacterium]|uniref:ribosome biogenesis factor YjgA n=1 Tax=Alcanivorax sp. TaxID=1872427 RepID=UPI00243B7158|nr:ribosome biogenesis factor YjgA [Alcanivorax sp.]MEE3321735.1 ribosome biogenesis factor YjgA [Pseudomonadota bacterium]
MTEYNDDLYTSKSEQKRDDLALQELGQTLMALKQGELDRLPLSDALKKGLEEARRITSNEARRRHSLYIGRLVRESDSDQIEKALAALKDPFRQQRLSNWVDQIANSDQAKDADSTLQQILEAFPHGDRQQLRNLTRNTLKAKLSDPESASNDEKDKFKRERRKLMNYLNQLDKTAPLY